MSRPVRKREPMQQGWHCNDCDEWERYTRKLEVEKANLKSAVATAEQRLGEAELERTMNAADLELSKNATNGAQRNSSKAVKDLSSRASALAVLAVSALEAPTYIPVCQELSLRHLVGDEKKVGLIPPPPPTGLKEGGAEDGARADSARDDIVAAVEAAAAAHAKAAESAVKGSDEGEDAGAGSGEGGSESDSESASGSEADASEGTDSEGEGVLAREPALRCLEVLPLSDLVDALRPWVASETFHDAVLFPASFASARQPLTKSNPAGVPAHAGIIACRTASMASAWFGETVTRDGGILCAQTHYSRPTLLALMAFLYTDEVPLEALEREAKDAGELNLSTVLQLYHAAQKYNLPLLRQQMQERIEGSINTECVLRYLQLAHDFGELEEVRDFCTFYVTEKRDTEEMRYSIDKCDNVVVLRQASKNQETNPFAYGTYPTAESTLREDLEKLLNAARNPAEDGMYFDLRLVSPALAIRAHRVLVAARCKVFGQELQTIPKDFLKAVADPAGPAWGLTPEFVHCLLRYLYTNTVRIAHDANILLFYSLAKLLNLQPLTHWVSVCIQATVDRSNVLKILKFAHSHLSHATAIRLKQHCLALLERDCSIMKEYESEVRKLRDCPDLLRELIVLTQTSDGKPSGGPDTASVEQWSAGSKMWKQMRRKKRAPKVRFADNA